MIQDHDAPESEGAARAAQFAAMSVTVLEAVARLRAQRATEHATADERIAAGERAQRIAEHAGARVRWSPAHDDTWLHRAGSGDLARAWGAAAIWADTDVDAHEAVQRVERRLQELHPAAMTVYHEARAACTEPADAMRTAAPLFAGQPATQTTADSRQHHDAATPKPRDPRDVAADGYPYPTAEAVASAGRRRSAVPAITSVPAGPRRAASR
jgi:hypothetical protein